MQQHATNLISLLSQRLRALQSLAREVTAGQEACIALDLEKLYAHDRQKELLCAQVRRLDVEIGKLRESIRLGGWNSEMTEGRAGHPDADTARRLQNLWQECEAARVEVGKRNQVYGEFLRRARSTLSIMINIMSHCLGIYPASSFATATGSFFERGQ